MKEQIEERITQWTALRDIANRFLEDAKLNGDMIMQRHYGTMSDIYDAVVTDLQNLLKQNQ